MPTKKEVVEALATIVLALYAEPERPKKKRASKKKRAKKRSVQTAFDRARSEISKEKAKRR